MFLILFDDFVSTEERYMLSKKSDLKYKFRSTQGEIVVVFFHSQVQTIPEPTN
jgi:proteasome lid subunit RPN8/RPN11